MVGGGAFWPINFKRLVAHCMPALQCCFVYYDACGINMRLRACEGLVSVSEEANPAR